MSKILRCRVTKAAVDRLAGNEMIRDADLRGFGVRRQLGTPVYFLQKRVNGRVRWMTIGPHGSPWTAETARQHAHRLLGEIAGGGDPQHRKQQDRERPNLADASKTFMAEHGPKLKPLTHEKYEHPLNRYLVPALGHKRLDTIDRGDVLRFHANLATYPRLANYAVAVLSRLMTWAEDRGYRKEQSNPCLRLKKYQETKRQRYLAREELAKLGRVLDTVDAAGGENLFIVAAIRLLLFTGARLSEILTLKWSYVDFERSLLMLPDSKTGQKIVRLNQHAAAVLHKLPRLAGNPYVIVGRRADSHLINLQKPWRRIRALAGLGDVRIHDLRHSFASVAAASRASLPMIGNLLGHNHTQTTARYAHLADDPMHQLNQQIGDAIASAMTGSAPPAT